MRAKEQLERLIRRYETAVEAGTMDADQHRAHQKNLRALLRQFHMELEEEAAKARTFLETTPEDLRAMYPPKEPNGEEC